jgi:cysteinyl-tRNA synthetase
MSKKYLGFPFDLHTGGIDHLPIHHSNEIAQNDALYGKNQVHYWLHNEFVMVNNEKMSKSKNNFYRVADLEKHGHTPLAFRYYSLLVHYRNRLNFTWEGLSAAERSLVEIQREVRRLSAITKKEKGMFGLWRARQGKPEPYWHERFKNNLSDDLNTPLAVATLWDLVREETKHPVVKLPHVAVVQGPPFLGIEMTSFGHGIVDRLVLRHVCRGEPLHGKSVVRGTEDSRFLIVLVFPTEERHDGPD